MSTRGKQAAAFVSIWALMLAPAALASAVLWFVLAEPQRRSLAALVQEGAPLLVVVVAGAAFVAWVVTRWAFASWVEPCVGLAQGVRVMITANPSHRVAPEGSPEVSALAGSINAFADERQMLLHDVERRIGEANRQVQEERNRLAALVSDLAQSVLVCNGDGRILLYNEQAKALLEPSASARGSGASLVGLGRSVFAFFDRSLVTHALESIWVREQKGEHRAVASFVTTMGDGRLVRLQVAPVRGASPETAPFVGAGLESLGGFVLVFEDVTPAVVSGSRTDVALGQLIEASRRALGSIRASVETLVAFPGMAPEKQARFMEVIEQEAASLTKTLERAAGEQSSAPSSQWMLEDMAAADLVTAIANRIERELGVTVRPTYVDPALWLKVDSFALVQAIVSVARRTRDELGVRELRLRLDAPGRHAHLDIGWPGAGIPPGDLTRWESLPASATRPLTLKEVVERHGGELWYQTTSGASEGFLRVLLPVTRRAPPAWRVAPRWSARPEYYDFDLFHQADQSAELDERKLADLAYTVFDTETTGLQPSEGDEIVCIGAVRIVNGRLLRHECYEQFVDPRRPLSVDSIKVTGIHPEMLAGQPPIDSVLPEFHRFCEDTVLVAHNAAFDLRFLQLKEEKAGVRFTHPVLDTLLLSAAIQSQGGAFQLEAMAERLGIPVIGRHTALGDAIMTGEIFLRLLPLLAGEGIVTLKDAREASERTFRARLQY